METTQERILIATLQSLAATIARIAKLVRVQRFLALSPTLHESSMPLTMRAA